MACRRKKVTTYIDEDLLISVKALAARSDVRMYEVFNEALRRHFKEVEAAEPSLDAALPGQNPRRSPGVPPEKAVKLEEGDTLSEAVIAERESRGY